MLTRAEQREQSLTMAEGSPRMRRRIAVGTLIESAKFKHPKLGRPLRGRIIGHDPHLDLPRVEWERAGGTEALEDHEYHEIIE